MDNHVIKCYQPGEYDSPRKRIGGIKNKKVCLLLGAEAADPSLFTKEYCGLFKDSGVVPKQILSRFFVSPEAALNPGTPLNALHYQVGNYVDVRGKTLVYIYIYLYIHTYIHICVCVCVRCVNN